MLPATHAPPAQQPVGHEVPSHTQVLATQRWPCAQVAPVPHRQSPAAEQLSERASHATQLAPALPQVVTERFEQVVPVQQPLGHEVASQAQAPLTQRWPVPQAGPAPHEQEPASVQ